jgi:hypothetical protein
MTKKAPAKQRKKPGPPRTTGPGEQVVVRLHNPLLAAIDDWCTAQEHAPTRAEALRQLSAQALGVDASPAAAEPFGAPKSTPATKEASQAEKTRPRRS